MDEEQIKQFVDAITLAVAERTAELGKTYLESIARPIVVGMSQLSERQDALAAVFRSARRDRNATEFMKTFVAAELAKADPEFGSEKACMIAQLAYAMANQMEIHAHVNEAQSGPLGRKVAEHVAQDPKADPIALARSFLGPTK